ncbi:hypothetical protein [Pseudomonas aeruginosa]|uniref:hypothetical protein n=1 Tax=Pseudomonas aeruginosa TaxID=287 RepID=UPI001F088EF0|nr:hypothetical protein [Pseudomonas aeruginosa]
MAEALSTQAPAKSAAAKRKRAGRPIYLEFKRMVDPDTGEVRLALVADSGIDKFLLKERGYRGYAEIKGEFTHFSPILLFPMVFFRTQPGSWGRLREGAESYAKALASDILR